MRLAPWFLVLTAALALSCSGDSTTLRVALDPHHPPLAFLDDNDQLSGFEVDLAQELARSLQRPLEFVSVPTQGLIRDVPWGGILAGLNNSSYDLVLSSVQTTADRRRDWGLSTPYLTTGPILVLRQDGASSPLAEWTSGPLGVVIGSQGQAAAARALASRAWSRVYYDLESALEDLCEHRVEAVVADHLEVAALRLENEKFALKLKTQGPVLESESGYAEKIFVTYSVVAAKANQPLLDQVNGALASLEADGTLARLRSRWLLATTP